MSAQRVDEAWQIKAACRGPQAEVFFPPSHFERKDEKLDREHRAKAICATCSVRQPCLAYAIKIREPHGIWGGLNEAERKQLGARINQPLVASLLDDLLAHDGVEEHCVLRSRVGLMAFHGGNLERGTDLIATAAAERAGASLYAVLQPPDLRWHVPSHEFRPDRSPALSAFVDHVDVAIAVHGYGRHGMWTTLLAGGTHRPLAAALGDALRDRLGEGFTVVADLEAIPRELRGVHPRNPVNLPRHGGVQLELPPRVRRHTGAPSYQPAYEEAVIAALAEVAAPPQPI